MLIDNRALNGARFADYVTPMDQGAAAKLDRYVGYDEFYDISHEVLDDDMAVPEAVCNVTRAAVRAVNALRAGRLSHSDKQIDRPRTT